MAEGTGEIQQPSKNEPTSTEHTQRDEEALHKTRREFLKLMGKGAIAATVATTLGNISVPEVESPELSQEEGYRQAYQAEQRKFWESLRVHEAPEQLSDNVVMIDFAPSKPTEGFQQNDFPQESDLLKNLLGNDAIDESQLVAEFGPDFRNNKDILYDQVFRKYPKLAMVYDSLNRFTTHGEKVGTAMQHMWNILGFKNSIHITPLQNMINTENTAFDQDELENQGFFIDINPQLIIEQLKQYPDQKIVNFSFQVGTVGSRFVTRERRNPPKPDVYTDIDENGKKTYYLNATKITPEAEQPKFLLPDGTPAQPMSQEEYEKFVKERNEKESVIEEHAPRVKTIDAYNPQTVKENMPKLVSICNAFPDKLFFASAGNEVDDLRTVESLLPSNLIMVGQWNPSLKRPNAKVYGADIYVDNRILGLPDGSSFSTPVFSAYASVLLNRGLSHEEIKEKLYSTCESQTFKDEDENQTDANVFNPQQLKDVLKN